MQFSADEEFAKQLDSEDPLCVFREKFHLPLGKDGKPFIYFAGNSLGLMRWSSSHHRLAPRPVWVAAPELLSHQRRPPTASYFVSNTA